MKKSSNSALVIFTEELPQKSQKWWRQFKTVIAPKRLEKSIHKDLTFVNIDSFVEAGNIYKANAFLEELSRLKLADGSLLAKSFVYRDYELWWIHYNSLFLYFCLPYTQYKKLLEYLRDFRDVYFYQPPYKSLFTCYLRAYGRKVNIVHEPRLRMLSFLPLGIIFQILITLLCLSVLVFKRRHLMVFTGDKFEKSKDYDFRMKFIYQELRQRNLPFVEFIRSLESWKTVLRHAFTRKRPVVYSEAVAFIGRFCSILSGGRYLAERKFGAHTFVPGTDSETRFRFLVATQYLLGIYDDLWAIRIMKWILHAVGIKAAFITAATERNFHTVLGCKLNAIPTVGILHGAASRYFVAYDFMPGFDGAKMLSVNKYGLWSEWWRKYYIKHSRAYKPEQLYVSGPMRPLENKNACRLISRRLQKNGPIKVLFVPGQLSEPKEIMPYLLTLMETKDISTYLTFRPYRDGFENWLKENNPEVFGKIDKEKILRDDIHKAISQCDVIVGCYSTAVLEALLQLKPLIFFKTNKWGDYFGLKSLTSPYKFFAENPLELINCIRQNADVPEETLEELQIRFFGDPHRNGSKWAVEQIEKFLLADLRKNSTIVPGFDWFFVV